jgi:hypothetical protein
VAKRFTHHSTPKVSNPTFMGVETIAPPSPEAANAGYKTTAVIVGGSPVRIYARDEKTLHEIRGILSQPNLLSGDEINDQTVPMKEAFGRLGFHENTHSKLGGICMSGFSAAGYVTGNEQKRQQDLRSPITSNGENAGSFQSCQPPDKAKIAGARVLAELNSLVRTVESCAARCASASDKKTASEQVAGRKQVIEGLLEICNNPENRIAIPEGSVEGNPIGAGRTFFPLLSGAGTALAGMLMDPETGEITAGRLQELAKDHSPEFVKQMVETAYKVFPGKGGKREELEASYKEYCDINGKSSPDLGGQVLNDRLRGLVDMWKEDDAKLKDSNLSPKEREAIIDNQELLEIQFQTWVETHRQRETDGSITVNVGHTKIMVSNEEQLRSLTLRSLAVL